MKPKEVELVAEDLEAAENLVSFADVQEGDRVMITRDDYVNVQIVEAIRRACIKRGAFTFDVWMTNPHLDLKKAEGLDFRDIAYLYEPLIRGLDSVDIWISLTTGFSQMNFAVKAQLEYGMNLVVSEAYSTEYTRSEYFRFPHHLQDQIWNRVAKQLSGKHELRITSPSGTDYTAVLPPPPIGWIGSATVGPILTRPGNWLRFPGTCFSFCPITSNGVFVADYYGPPLCPIEANMQPFTDPKNPMVMTIDDCWVVDIKGHYAEETVRLWETKGNKASRYDCGPMLGLSLKGFPTGWPGGNPLQWYFPLHSSPWMTHLHLGALPGLSRLRELSSPIIVTPYTYNATWIADGEVIVRNGRYTVLDDPELKEIAARYGDPKKLLEPLRFPPEIFPTRPRDF